MALFGSTLGEVLVSVGVDTKQLDTGLAKARTQTETAGSTMSKFGTLATVGFAVAGAAVIGFANSAVKAYEESQKVAAQTNAVIESTGKAAGLTAEDVHTLASAFQDLTSFSDESVQSAENLLLTFTKISGHIFPQATQAVLDMSTALGQDLKSSSIQLGKALNDPIKGVTALQRVGVSFSDSQKDMIRNLVETNHLLDAQKIILSEVAKEFGGSAFEQAGTLEGRLKSLGNEWDDLKEGVGGAIGAVIQAGVSFGDFTANLAGFNASASDVAEVLHAMGDPGGSMDLLNAVTKDGSLSFKEFQGVLEYAQVSLDGATGATDDLAAAQEAAAEAAKAQRDAEKALQAALPGLIGDVLALKKAQKDLHQAQQDSSTSAADMRDKELAVVEAFASVQGAFGDVLSDYRAGDATLKDVIGKFKDQARQAGLTKDQIQDLLGVVQSYINKLKDIPTSVHTTVTASGGGNVPRMAAGGIVTRPTFALIGESGPEAVIPLNRSGVRGGDGATVNVYVAGSVIAERDLMRNVRRAAQQGAVRNAGHTGFA